MRDFTIYKLIIILALIIVSQKAFATAQYPDILIDGKDTFAIYSNPLEQYLAKKHNRKLCGEKLEWTSTACYRGYQAMWIIQNDSLFLLRIKHGCGNDSEKYFDLGKEFHTDKKVFAKWFTGRIMSPRGELLQYIHAGYGSIFEKEKSFFFKKGRVDSIENKTNLVYDKNLLNPSERLLSDTLREIIISNLDLTLFKDISESDACEINIRFNSNGVIDSISNEFVYDGISFLEKTILAVAQKSLKNLPHLMKVTHERYVPPTITLYFCGHCMKYPWDIKYGCPVSKKYSHAPKSDDSGSILKRCFIIWVPAVFGLILVISVIFIIFKRCKRSKV